MPRISLQRLAVGKLHDGVVELAAADEVEHRALVQRAVRVGRHRRPDKRDANRRIGCLDGLGQPLIALPAHGRGEQHQELVVLADLDGLFGRDVMRRGIQQARALQQYRPDR